MSWLIPGDALITIIYEIGADYRIDESSGGFRKTKSHLDMWPGNVMAFDLS